ncbi:MAG: hypothetical protein ACT4NU_04320 [Chromatiales bacterium]
MITTDRRTRIASEQAPFAEDVNTPAFVFDGATISLALQQLDELACSAGLRVLFSIKACPLSPLLSLIAKHVDGFSVSSWFESRIARMVLADKGSVHLTSPGLEPTDLPLIAATCDYVSFNSLSQWQRLGRLLPMSVQRGLRVNPQQTFVQDERYNPCRPHSKLGVPLDTLAAVLGDRRVDLSALSGLHFHSHCESRSFQPLAQTLDRLEGRLGPLFERLRWLNVGGGYMADAGDADSLICRVREIKTRFGVEVFFEPGKAVVDEAGSLTAGVVDIFDSEGGTVAVLDTSVNHLPEVFEYRRRPRLLEAVAEGSHRYWLAGGTCLAGDLFGEYAFSKPLAIGSRVTFVHVGAYSLAKAHRFNGHNLPSVYLREADGRLRLLKRYGFDDYARQWCDL